MKSISSCFPFLCFRNSQSARVADAVPKSSEGKKNDIKLVTPAAEPASPAKEAPLGEKFEVKVRGLADTEDTIIPVSSQMTVGRLKNLIKERMNVQESMQKLVLEETILNNIEARLCEYDVKAGANILVIKVVAPFAIGKEIEGKDANGRWMVGSIQEENSDGTLVLSLTEDGRVWPKVYKANTRQIPEFQLEESLEGMDANGKWFPIVVKGINDDGTYACDVLKPDGSIQRRWDKSLRRNMRYVEDFVEHPDANYYGFDCNGKAWSVKITRKNDNGSYYCEVQDGHNTKWPEALRCNLW